MALKLRNTFPLPHRLTRAGKELAAQLEKTRKPVATPHEIFNEILRIYRDGQHLYLRKKTPDITDYRRLRKNLIDANILAPDNDYRSRAYRILKNADLPADEICCLVDADCYISHISAMQRYGLTNRRPEALHLSRPSSQVIRQRMQERIGREHNEELAKLPIDAVPARMIVHPRHVRGRKISLFQSIHPGEWVQVRDSYARISTIGQTFLDTLEEPSLCSGMAHVLDMWRAQAKTYMEEIIAAVDRCSISIVKVRAGYILEELLNLKDPRITAWQRFAQRGGSRLLDPTKQYAPSFSEKWMLSVNV